jgi:hypothetical protein
MSIGSIVTVTSRGEKGTIKDIQGPVAAVELAGGIEYVNISELLRVS